MILRQIAHARSGDKGNTANIAVIAYDMRHYEHIARHLTVERVARHFGSICKGTVTRYDLPKIGAFNFVLTEALSGGVVRSLTLDSHGKSLSSALLGIEIPAPHDGG